MRTIKTLFLSSFIIIFILVGLSMAPMLQGMPISSQLANVASTTMQYIRDMMSPLVDFYYRHVA
jgi:CBS domain containing-hemolysin-like protein